MQNVDADNLDLAKMAAIQKTPEIFLYVHNMCQWFIAHNMISLNKILLESLINWKVETIQDKPSHSYKLQRGTLALTVAASSKAQPIRSPQFKSKILHYKTQTKPDVQFKQTAATSIISIDKQTQMMNAIII